MLSPSCSFDQTAAGGDERRVEACTSGGMSSTGAHARTQKLTHTGRRKRKLPTRDSNDTTFQSKSHKHAASWCKMRAGGQTDVDHQAQLFVLEFVIASIFTTQRMHQDEACSEQGQKVKQFKSTSFPHNTTSPGTAKEKTSTSSYQSC